MITVKSGKNPISSPPNTKCHSAMWVATSSDQGGLNHMIFLGLHFSVLPGRGVPPSGRYIYIYIYCSIYIYILVNEVSIITPPFLLNTLGI